MSVCCQVLKQASQQSGYNVECVRGTARATRLALAAVFVCESSV
jgi:hypothetical protein